MSTQFLTNLPCPAIFTLWHQIFWGFCRPPTYSKIGRHLWTFPLKKFNRCVVRGQISDFFRYVYKKNLLISSKSWTRGKQWQNYHVLPKIPQRPKHLFKKLSKPLFKDYFTGMETMQRKNYNFLFKSSNFVSISLALFFVPKHQGTVLGLWELVKSFK